MKRVFKVAAALVAVLVLALAAVFLFVDANQFRPELEAQLSQALQRSVHLGDIRLAPFSGGASSSELTISDDPEFSTQPFLKSGLLEIGVDLTALVFSRTFHVRSLAIDDAEVALICKIDGSWNFSSLGTAPPAPAPVAAATSPAPPPSPPAELSVKLIRVDKARVRLTDGRTTRTFHDVNFELRDFSRSSTMPFSLSAEVAGGGGKIKLTGTAGPLASNVVETPFDTQIEIDELDLTSGGTGGVLQIRGNANSNGKTAAMTGAVVVDKLKLSKTGTPAAHPVAVNLVLAHDMRTRRGNLARSTVKLGSATANLQGNYEFTVDSNLDLTLDGANMPLSELLVFLPAMDVQLPAGSTLQGGTITMNASSRSRGATSTAKGSVKIEKTRLENYDLGAKLGVLQQFAKLPSGTSTEIALASADFENSLSGTQLRNILMDVPVLGKLTGAGAVSPDHALNFRMKAAIRNTNVPFLVRGTSSDPQFRADIASFAQGQLRDTVKNPEGDAKKGRSLIDKAKGVLDFFKRGRKKNDPKQ